MNTKEKIIEALEGKSTETLADEYVEAEKKLLRGLEKLKNWGDDCNCDETTEIKIIFEGEYPEISTYCLKCGGYLNE